MPPVIQPIHAILLFTKFVNPDDFYFTSTNYRTDLILLEFEENVRMLYSIAFIKLHQDMVSVATIFQAVAYLFKIIMMKLSFYVNEII